MSDSPTRMSRRALLLGGGAGILAAGAAATVGVAIAANAPDATPPVLPAVPGPVPSDGVHQAGIERPSTPQRNAVLATADAPAVATRAGAAALLAAVGETVARLTDPGSADPRVLPDGPGDLTITVGLGPRLVRAVDPSLPGAADLPAFAGDSAMDARDRGGDLMVEVCSSDAAPLHAVVDAVLAAAGATRRWAQAGVRGAGEGMVARNPLGFHDGIVVPHTDAEYAENVWIGSGPAAGGTILVVRRLRLDAAAFRALDDAAQERAVGRTRDGVPLSGGTAADQVDLTAKTPEGEYRVPARAHARAAHPSFTGSALMLRRGYAFSNAVAAGDPADDGLLFVCYQRDLGTFVRTQQRLDEADDLMRFATPTASATFLVVPGRQPGSPLGASLFRSA